MKVLGRIDSYFSRLGPGIEDRRACVINHPKTGSICVLFTVSSLQKKFVRHLGCLVECFPKAEMSLPSI